MNAMKAMAAALVVAAAVGCVSTGSVERQVRYVDEFDLSGSSCGLGKTVKKNLSVDGHPLTMSKKVYSRGFGEIGRASCRERV